MVKKITLLLLTSLALVNYAPCHADAASYAPYFTTAPFATGKNAAIFCSTVALGWLGLFLKSEPLSSAVKKVPGITALSIIPSYAIPKGIGHLAMPLFVLAGIYASKEKKLSFWNGTIAVLLGGLPTLAGIGAVALLGDKPQK